MNKAFKNNILKWYGSRYYKVWARSPKRTFKEYLGAQSNKCIQEVLGVGKAELFKLNQARYSYNTGRVILRDGDIGRN